ncbi:MAG TPA: nickel-dependent lactate racemase [Tepidisphaeraceae bacterium]|nr:nickel-dependent lactate racemase [Tepidisphaeraceae bacterium]
MRIEFPYKGYEKISPVEVPDANLIGVFKPRKLEGIDEKKIIADGFANPLGAPRLREAVKKGQRVLIIIDDASRGTQTWKFLPHVFEELHAGGVRDADIEFIQGVGTHRPMTDAEEKEKLGDYFGKYKIHEHHWLDRAQLHSFGTTRDGTPVTANKLATQFDFIMGIGSVVPHRVKGMSGGAKIMFPGISGPEMMERNQWEASMQMSETVMGVPENPMRLRMEEAARIAGLKYVICNVGDVSKQTVGCYAGDFVASHRAACLRSREAWSVHIPTRCDILLIDAHAADRDFWQSAKGAYCGTMCVKDSGTLILVAPNPEGMAKNHKNLMEIGYKPSAQIVHMVQQGGVKDLVGVAILHDTCQIVDKTDCIMVSPGVSDADARKIGFRYAKDGQEALRMALEKQRKNARITVLHHGGEALPIIEDEKAELVASMT